MKSQPISSWINFGTGLRYLQDAQKGYSIEGTSCVLENIDGFLKKLDKFNLKVTERAAGDLKSFKSDLEEKCARLELEKKDVEKRLTQEEAKQLKEIIKILRITLFAEAKGFSAYVATEKRIDVEKLINNVSSLMAPNIFENLTKIGKYDFEEGCKCIAFERPTAAAFHLLRGTEAELREYYYRKKKILRKDQKSFKSWYTMTTELRNLKSLSIPDSLLNNLDNIRENYRNPTQHPELIYDIEDVQNLFPLCVEIVNRMVSQRVRKKKKVKTP
ncbi:hypothetical protein [Methanoregula sp.]|jgi:hypothetical protein|uniref:hypothetical protein n=1 Tax=Methanoregula sp. TaxID=2052170 RepID=UPI003C1AED67